MGLDNVNIVDNICEFLIVFLYTNPPLKRVTLKRKNRSFQGRRIFSREAVKPHLVLHESVISVPEVLFVCVCFPLHQSPS